MKMPVDLRGKLGSEGEESMKLYAVLWHRKIDGKDQSSIVLITDDPDKASAKANEFLHSDQPGSISFQVLSSEIVIGGEEEMQWKKTHPFVVLPPCDKPRFMKKIQTEPSKEIAAINARLRPCGFCGSPADFMGTPTPLSDPDLIIPEGVPSIECTRCDNKIWNADSSIEGLISFWNVMQDRELPDINARPEEEEVQNETH